MRSSEEVMQMGCKRIDGYSSHFAKIYAACRKMHVEILSSCLLPINQCVARDIDEGTLVDTVS